MNPPPAQHTLDLLVAHRDWVRRLARTMTTDDASAEDLVQDACVAAIRSPPRRDGWREWMRRVLRNRSRNVHRETTRRAVREAACGPRGTERATADVVAEADAHRHVVDAVLDLAEPLRTAVLLRYFEDLAIEDVARRMDAPIETTRSRLRRARAILGERLDGEHGGRSVWCVPLASADSGLHPQAADHAAPHTAVVAPDSRTTGTRSASCAVGATIGALLMKKTAAALLVFLLFGYALWTQRGADDDPTPPGDRDHAAARASPGAVTTTAPGAAPRPRVRADAASADPVANAQDAGDRANEAEPGGRAAAAAAMRRIAGRVSTTDGRPVAGAVVAACPIAPQPAETGAATAAAAAPPGGAGPGTAAGTDTSSGAAAGTVAPLVEPASVPILAASTAFRAAAVTRIDGTFDLEVPAAATPLRLVATADGFVPTWIEPGAADTSVELRLRRGVSLRVRVLGPGGRPAPGRTVRVRDDGNASSHLASGVTGPDGDYDASGLPGGSLVSVATDVAGRLAELRARIRLADTGTTFTELRDDGVRRILVHAVIEGSDVPAGAVLVEPTGGPGELRAWPGGTSATIEIPAGDVELSILTAAGRGDPVRPAAAADEVTLRARIPPVRWVEVDRGAHDPRFLQFAGGRDASELFFAGDLSAFGRSGRLRLPLVEGAEYSIRRPDGFERLLGTHTSGLVSIDEPAARVAVGIVTATGPLPAGTKATAEPVFRATRMAREKAEAAVLPDGSLTLSLLPGITYGVVVTAPGSASARIEHRPGPAGGEVRVELHAGAPIRFRVPGLEPGARCAVATFPGYAKLEGRNEAGTCVIDGAGDGWVLVMAGGTVHLVRGGPGSDSRVAPASSGFVPDVKGAPAGRLFLLGLDPLADGVRAVGLAGAPMAVPAGRYLPVEWRGDGIAIHDAVTLDAASRSWSRPADADVRWTEGRLEGSAPLDLVIELPDGALPLGRLVPGRVTTWRSTMTGVRTEAVR